MNPNNQAHINEIVGKNTKLFPSVIELKKPVIFPDSIGLWIRFKDEKYHNSLCHNTEFHYSVLKKSIEDGNATIISYKPQSKETLLAMFPEDKRPLEYKEIMELYKT